jgi:hypothetical protein
MVDSIPGGVDAGKVQAVTGEMFRQFPHPFRAGIEGEDLIKAGGLDAGEKFLLRAVFIDVGIDTESALAHGMVSFA